MKKPTLSELINEADKKNVVADWDRRDELMKRFNGLSKSQLGIYQKEMEKIPEFREGILKPNPNITFIHVHTFVWFLKWREANRYLTKKLKPEQVLHL